MSRFRPEIERYAAARVAANARVHGLSGSAEYDDEVRERAVFSDQARAVTIPDSWRLPPVPVLLTAVVLIVCAEVGGASMVRFKLELTRWARQAMLERPGTHGLVGVRDVDERVLDEALVKFDAGLRLFHLHAEGMGLVIIATATVAATLAGSPASRRPIIALLTVGGAGCPLGHLLWSGLIPYYGPERGKTIAEWLVWTPFGGATIVALWWLAGLVAWRMMRRERA